MPKTAIKAPSCLWCDYRGFGLVTKFSGIFYMQYMTTFHNLLHTLVSTVMTPLSCLSYSNSRSLAALNTAHTNLVSRLHTHELMNQLSISTQLWQPTHYTASILIAQKSQLSTVLLLWAWLFHRLPSNAHYSQIHYLS